MFDLTDYQEYHEGSVTKTIVSYSIRMGYKTILKALGSDCIVINGDRFKVPEKQLIDCLVNKEYGCIRLDLEKID
ncbi:hypothetical protein [Thalassobellus citreus]|uniref:hypothetical protein n=1 Tax=Thalassobellus citreus TaxID=3367752 RepID=UPI0037A75CDC